MIIAVLKDTDSDAVTQGLTSSEFRVTRVASTGGLLRRGVTTLLAGVEDERTETAIRVVRENVSPAGQGEKRATIFVVPVDRFVQV
jgi:uncharacterized protein YaaQ